MVAVAGSDLSFRCDVIHSKRPANLRSLVQTPVCALASPYSSITASARMQATPVFGRGQTGSSFRCGFLQEDAEIRERKPTSWVGGMVAGTGIRLRFHGTLRILHAGVSFHDGRWRLPRLLELRVMPHFEAQRRHRGAREEAARGSRLLSSNASSLLTLWPK